MSNTSANAVHAFQDGKVIAYGATITCAGTYGVHAQTGAEVIVSGADLSGAGSAGILASDSRVSAQAVNARKGGADHATDVAIQIGSIVSFEGGTGGTNVTVNTVSAAGIIFR